MNMIQLALIIIFQTIAIGFTLRARHWAEVAEHHAEQAERHVRRAITEAQRAEHAAIVSKGGMAS